MNILEKLLGMSDSRPAATDNNRPIKFVQERENVWRVVYAD